MRYTHCSNCDFPMEDDEIAFQESGSIVSEPVNLCESCVVNIHGAEYDVTLEDDWTNIFDELEYWG